MRLKGKRAIITGAASGIGREGVKLFAREGATVAAIDINPAALKDTVDENKPDHDVIPVVADLSRREDCRRAVNEAMDKLGGIDVLWCHAGIPVFGDFDGLDMARADMASELNLMGPVVTIGEALRRFRQQGSGGSIVMTASMSGLVGSTQSPLYSVHKFGVVGMVKSLALSIGKDKIRINAVCPGHTHTPAMEEFLIQQKGANNIEAALDELGALNALGRPGKPEEMAHAALWLASDDSSFVTGVALAVDGGYTAK